MSTEGIFLVTTADERTWDVNRKIVFLGGWCLRYDRKNIWNQLNSEIAPPYGLELNVKLKNIELSESMQSSLLPSIVKVLNNHHNTNHSLNFWKIIIGHWLKYFVDIIISRHHTLIQVNKQFKIVGSKFIELSASSFIPTNTLDMLNLLKLDAWNSTLDLRVIQNTDELKFSTTLISELTSNSRTFHKVDQNHIKIDILSCIKQLCNFFVRSSEPFIISSYLPMWQEIKLQLSYGQVPKFWRNSQHHSENVDPDVLLRKRLTKQILLDEDNVFTRLVFELMPICFLEGFANLSSQVKNTNWPRKPKFIFTSNDFAFNETFKLYSALCQERGTKYFIGQHGNNYGTNRFLVTNVEESTSDFFLTWGWQNQNESILPAYVFKVAGLRVENDKKGDLLLLEYPYEDRLTTWDTDREHQIYFDNLLLFIGLLDEKPFKHLKVRLHYESATNSFNSKQRLIESFPAIRIEYWEQPILQQYKNSRLAIFSYDSTGILETLALNIPTIAFWQNGFDHLNETAKKHYQLMVDAGIFHLSPESIAETINTIWEDVDSWWRQDSIQFARKTFCEQYARTSRRPIRDLRKLLKETTYED